MDKLFVQWLCDMPENTELLILIKYIVNSNNQLQLSLVHTRLSYLLLFSLIHVLMTKLIISCRCYDPHPLWIFQNRLSKCPPPPLQKCHFCHTPPWKYHSLWKPKYKLFLVQNTKFWSLLFSQKLWWILWPTHHQIVRTLNMQNVQIIISFCSVFLTQFDLLSDMNVTAVVQNFYIIMRRFVAYLL